MTEPPSVRIAGELRAQIERGELAPGERVPSAREITRRWGVAIATATRVLAALRDDGLVRAGARGRHGRGGSGGGRHAECRAGSAARRRGAVRGAGSAATRAPAVARRGAGARSAWGASSRPR